MSVRAASLFLGFALFAAAQTTPGPVLVITASARDCIMGAGGTLANMAQEGRAIYVAVMTNEEKSSVGKVPADTRIANNNESEAALKLLGVREVINLGHKAGELGYISSSELRNQVMTLTRLYKPEIMFFPDWYTHYLNDLDIWYTGHMAEESPYGGGSLFLQEMTYLGHPGTAARQYYFFSPYRPYRSGEGGEGNATMKQVDVSSAMDKKMTALGMLKTSNGAWAEELRKRSGRTFQDENFVSAFAKEMAETIGSKHGMRFAEEFNHLRPVPGLPAHVLEHAKKK